MSGFLGIGHVHLKVSDIPEEEFKKALKKL